MAYRWREDERRARDDDRYRYGGQGYVEGGGWPARPESYGRGGYGRTRLSDYGRYVHGHDEERDRYGYGAGPYYGRGFEDAYGHGREEDRGWWERIRDELRSMMSREDEQRSRRMDEMRGGHYGRGPRGYARSDDRIREDVSDRLTDDWLVDASDIEVVVGQCEVTLNGTVDSREAKRRAEDLAESVSGVRHVQNNLRLRQGGGAGAGAEQSRTASSAGTTGSKH